MLQVMFSTVTLAAMFRLATPLILAAVGGSFGDRAGVFNIALESFMLSAAFFATLGSYLTRSPYVGALAGILTGSSSRRCSGSSSSTSAPTDLS